MTGIPKGYKPMLAGKCEDTAKLQYPVIASPKLDGIRCVIFGGVAYSRNLKPIRNKTVQAWAQKYAEHLEGMDGELISGEHDELVFNRTTSVVMSVDGGEEWRFKAFDLAKTDMPYEERSSSIMMDDADGLLPEKVDAVWTEDIVDEEMLLAYEAKCLAAGYEGVMVRSPDGPYKCGRSTAKEGYLLKVKRFADGEAVIVGFDERMHNQNAAGKDALGHTERSTAKAGLIPAGDLGALVVEDLETGAEFRIGTGYTADMRQEFWDKQEALRGRIVKYKHFLAGAVDLPRFPVFVGFRDPDDMS